MKNRNGFVSNSSSSSFVVAFDRETPDENYVRNQFGTVHYYSEYLRGNEMETLVHDTIHQVPVLICKENRDLLMENFFKDESLYFELFYRHDRIGNELKSRQDEMSHNLWDSTSEDDKKYFSSELNKIREEMDEYQKSALDARVDSWIEKNTGLYAFHYDYADDDGNGALEHGSHWNNVNVWVFSHH